MTEDLVAAIKELIRCYEECQPHSHSNKEIIMWRERFLSSLPKLEDKNKASKLWCYFLYTPSSVMMKSSPEKIIEELENENKPS